VNPSTGGGNGERHVDLRPFNWLVRGIFAVAVLCPVLQVVLGFAWPEPTAAQAVILSAVDWGWKLGLGYAVGLMTGKSFAT
jgi:hypothetical protein